ncbi:hypothetical protein B7R25_13825 [Subtercola boreus]|uniref:Uncharacterized protein n=2 Tax=Subtercola boreus TaxID=120213 RepID=A0A3E0W770_9MICO|nr:hypothetical protein [Subtercola boreus]RFA18797.1 hypothetical protein B7R24_13725 [Subtercola boreus]RFA18911.1 hypothetical protein B7R23_13715 [Subtercola boreus]RFA25449.1 hypothetical protein B7R25_13825 [Subtercola boreus]
MHYVNDVLLVSDDICEAVFEYAAALARASSADVVTIPTLRHELRSSSSLVLGSASQLFCSTSDTDAAGVDIDDPALVARLWALAGLLGTPKAVPFTPTMEWESPSFDDDLT